MCRSVKPACITDFAVDASGSHGRKRFGSSGNHRLPRVLVDKTTFEPSKTPVNTEGFRMCHIAIPARLREIDAQNANFA
jgi:hypothetical protein